MSKRIYKPHTPTITINIGEFSVSNRIVDELALFLTSVSFYIL